MLETPSSYLRPMAEISNPACRFFIPYIDGKSYYREFCDSLTQKADLAALDKIKALMDVVGICNLPLTKFRHIKGTKNDRDDVYDVLLGGFKKNQDKDIAKVFRHFNDNQFNYQIID